MRLVCPNCDAKYEVPEDAIPETGRDVQCANCGHAWYQMRRQSETAAVVPEPVPEPVVEPAPAPVVAAEVVPAPEPEVIAEAAPPEPDVQPVEAPVEAVAEETIADVPVAEEAGAASDDWVREMGAVEAEPMAEPPAALAGEAEPDDVDAPASTGAIAAAGVAAYAVDESVLAILREEANREAQARKAEEVRALETQTDLGLDSAMPAPRKGLEMVDEAVDDRLSARRTRLPDVEEIKSSLRPSDVAEDDIPVQTPAPAPVEGRSSFRSGFLLVMTVAILGSALYGSADAIANAVPALAEPLKSFVTFVDSLRLQLDGLMQSATVAINGN